MTAEDFREILAALGLSQTGAAKLFRTNDRTVRRWASGADIPVAVQIALLLMIRHNITPADAERLAA